MSERPKQVPRIQLPAGRIEVLPRAIATIAAQSVTQSDGVVGMAAYTQREGVAQLLRQQDAHKGVEVRVRGDAVVIDLYLIVAYGTRLTEVARKVQENVRRAVEQALGTPVTQVNVRVQGVR